MTSKPEHTVPTFSGPPGQPDMPWLMTPEFVTTSRAVKLALLADYDPASPDLTHVQRQVEEILLQLADAGKDHVCMLLALPQAAVAEAVLATFSATRRKKILVMSNGPSAFAVTELLEKLGRPVVRLEKSPSQPLTVADLEKALDADKDISHIWLTMSEPATGLVNEAADICRLAKAAGKVTFLDATLAFSTLPLSMTKDGIDVLITSSASALESVPGLCPILIQKTLLVESVGKSHASALDLNALYEAKALPSAPQLVTALYESLKAFEASGGQPAKRVKRQVLATALITRMKAMGFQTFLKDEDAGPFVQAFLYPRDPNFNFEIFAAHLRARGFAIAAGHLPRHKTFRVATLGHINEAAVAAFAATVEDVIKVMDLREMRPN